MFNWADYNLLHGGLTRPKPTACGLEDLEPEPQADSGRRSVSARLRLLGPGKARLQARGRAACITRLRAIFKSAKFPIWTS